MKSHPTIQDSQTAIPGIRRGLKGYLLGLAMAAGLTAIACTQGTYPLDIFYEMHYQQSYKSGEPPSLSAPESSVAFFPGPKSTSLITSTGEHLFAVNCSMCHGAGAKGDGPVISLLKEVYQYKPVIDPPDITDNTPESIEGILIATTRPFGPDSVMPPFGKLLSADEREAIIGYIGTLSPALPAPTTTQPPSPPPVTSGGLAISVNGDALEFDSDSFEVPAGTEVVLIFNNVSTVNQHNWVIVQAGKKDEVAGRGTEAGPGNDWVQPGDPDVIAHTALLNPGETGEVSFAAPPPGTYQFVCTFPGHNFTMFGDFIVTP